MSAGRLRIIKRTDGVSTTDLVGRLLMMTTEHHIASGRLHRATSGEMGAQHKLALTSRVLPSSSFMATTRRISQFSNNRSITPDDRVVYLAGSFDLFHVGHMETLIKAKALGTFLYVGILDDQTVNKMYGSNLPIMNLHERVLNVLSCRAVDEVLLCAPWAVTEALIKSLHVAVVASGGNVDEPCEGDKGRFDVAIAMVSGRIAPRRAFASVTRVTRVPGHTPAARPGPAPDHVGRDHAHRQQPEAVRAEARQAGAEGGQVHGRTRQQHCRGINQRPQWANRGQRCLR